MKKFITTAIATALLLGASSARAWEVDINASEPDGNVYTQDQIVVTVQTGTTNCMVTIFDTDSGQDVAGAFLLYYPDSGYRLTTSHPVAGVKVSGGKLGQGIEVGFSGLPEGKNYRMTITCPDLDQEASTDAGYLDFGQCQFWSWSSSAFCNVSAYIGDLSVSPNSNTPPVPSISVEGHSYGDTVSPGTNITVHYAATDVDGNLTGIRYNIWNSTTRYFDNGGGVFVAQSGGSGDLVKTFTLNTEGVWYVWTDAQDANGNNVSTGESTSGFKILVATPPPPPPPPTVESVTFNPNPVDVSTYVISAVVHNAKSVQLPTWVGSYSAKWYNATPIGNDVWVCTVKASDFNYASGTYFTDVYATSLNDQTTNLGRYNVPVNIPMGYITIGTNASYSNGSTYSQINFEINDLGFNGIVRSSVKYDQVDNPPGFEDITYTISRVGTGQGYVIWQLQESHFVPVSGSYYINKLMIARYMRMANKWQVDQIASYQAGPSGLNYMSVQYFAYNMYPQQVDWSVLVQKWDYNAPVLYGTYTVPQQPLQ